MLRASADWRGGDLIQLGLLVLLAASGAGRVFRGGVALQRDRFYVVVTLIVLGILLFSIFGGRL